MADQAFLVFHGGVVLLVGMLVGFPYGAAKVAGKDPVKEQNWRLAHNQNLQNGMLLLLVGACASLLQLGAGLAFMAWLLIAAAYCDMLALFIRAKTGHAGLLPSGPLANVIVFALFGGVLVGQLAGAVIFIYGAWQAMVHGAPS